MQGFIVNINKARDEDLIVTILSQEKLKTTYRFYGSRHSTINIGYLIDFEVQISGKSTIAQLRNVMHLAHSWNLENQRLYIWQQFVKLFYPHLRDVEEIDRFYFDLLYKCTKIWHKQNPKRVAIEAYLELLEFEGRLHSPDHCFICEDKIEGEVALTRAFLLAHVECVHGFGYDVSEIKELFETKKTFNLSDDKVDNLYQILCDGL